jgi:hypothetical protein
MSEPIVFISTHKIKEGKLEGFKERNRQVAQYIEANKPGTIAFLTYLNEEGTEMSIVHVFPDAEAMAHHMEGVGERAENAAEFLQFHRLDIYGSPDERTLQAMKGAEEAGVTVTVKPEQLSGYIRLESR